MSEEQVFEFTLKTEMCIRDRVNGGKDVDQHSFLENILRKNQFLAMYRKQIENVSAKGTAACYVRLDNADIKMCIRDST